MTPPYTAVVLAGGAARRLGGTAKPEFLLGGRRLVDRVLDAVADAAHRIVVGPPTDLPPDVRRIREEPPGGGPVAALAAALPYVRTGYAALVAADLPFLTAEVVQVLLAAVADHDGAVLTDDGGRDQRLIGAWWTDALRAAVAAEPTVADAPLHRVLARLDVVRVTWEVAPGTPPPWWDCDEPADLDRARGWLAEGDAT